MSEMKMHTHFQYEHLKGKDRLGDTGAKGKIILKWILRNYGARVWTGYN
jgi:hypothetical protein